MSSMPDSRPHSQPIDAETLFSIRGKVALVTGGSRGIGLMIARGFVEAGAKVYITSRSVDVCVEVAEELSRIGSCVALPTDISTVAGCEAMARELETREGALQVLVNNAGASWGEPIESFSEEGFDKVMDLNVKSVFFMTRELLPLLENAASDEDPARVINIGSINGISAPFLPNFSYAASKAAVHHLTRTLALHLGPRKITVNAIAPGPFESKMTKWLLDNYQEHLEEACPLGRIGAPPDIAGAAIYLASRAAAFVNGAVIPVDGGLVLK